MRTFKFLGFIVALAAMGLICFSCGNGNSSSITKNESVDKAGNEQVEEIPNHEYVDLGLPSGTLWATCNVGADSPEDYGSYFAWGETTTKNTYEWSNYHWSNSDGKLTKYCDDKFWGVNEFIDTRTVLEANDDAATVNWGKKWRMPTDAEMNELIDECSNKWTERNGIKGLLVTGPNGNSIFLPAAGSVSGNKHYCEGYCGEYWTSSIISGASYSAYVHRAYQEGFDMDEGYVDDNTREEGRTVRPVYY